MIKKVSNWVFGSFFRTMGRFFFFLFFGFIIAMIIQKNDWSTFKWTDLLGIEMVKADSWVNGVVTWTDTADQNLPQYYGQYKEFNYGTSYVNSQYRIKNGIAVPSGTKGVLFSVVFRQVQNTSEWTCVDYINTGSSQATCVKWRNYGIQNMSFNMIFNNEQSSFNCYWYDNTFTTILDNVTYIRGLLYCPIYRNSSNINRLEYNGSVGNNSNSGTYSIGFERSIMFDVSGDSSITNSIDNQTNQTISTITDSNTTEASSEANDFFSGFTSQDNGGISSIITAPLQAISGLVSAQCVQIELPIPYLDNKKLILPCMSAIYQEHFGAIFSLYQTIIFGAIAYRMLVSLFMMIQGFKNPDDDKIEVVDL